MPTVPPPALPVLMPWRDPALWTVLLLASAVWLPTLAYGYAEDDLWILKTGFAAPWETLRLLHTRIVWALSYALLPADALVQRLASLALAYAVLALLWRACMRAGLDTGQRLFALGALLHPAFIYAVTWIAQRCDLLLILFVLLALEARSARLRLLWIALGSAAKAPYVLQNLVFAGRDLRARRPVSALLVAALAALALLGVWASYHALSVERGGTLSSERNGLVALLAARAFKVAEGTAYVFAPAPSFWTGPWPMAAAALAYLAAWSTLGLRHRRALGLAGWGPERAAWLWVALSMLPPFAFASDVRIAAPATLFLFLALAPGLRRDAASRAAMVAITLLNLGASALNLGITDTGVFALGAPQATFAPVPLRRWYVERESLRAPLARLLGVSRPATTDGPPAGDSPSP